MSVNPAAALRATLSPHHPAGMLRYDTSGLGVLVSDALRHGEAGEGFHGLVMEQGLPCTLKEGLLHVDIREEAYADLLTLDSPLGGDFCPPWWEVQALAGVLLSRPPKPGMADKALLRKAMVACALGEGPVLSFAQTLARADAAALAKGDGASLRAAAALMGQFLRERGMGVPEVPGVFITWG